MSLLKPYQYALWKYVDRGNQWPDGDEDGLAALGRAWTELGAGFLYVSSSTHDLPDDAWPDEAGRLYDQRIETLRGGVLTQGERMKRLGALAGAYGEDVRYAKVEITEFVGSWDPLFQQAPDEVGPVVAQKIDEFMALMAERIAARGDPAASEVPRATLPTREEIQEVGGIPPNTGNQPITKQEYERRQKLGFDPAVGRVRPEEINTALRIEAERGVTLTRAQRGDSFDWVDQAGRSYDALGPFDAKYFAQQWPQLQAQIAKHVNKAELVPIDVSKFTPQQIAQVEQFVSKNYGPNVFIVGN
jgi:hypothetical protein